MSLTIEEIQHYPIGVDGLQIIQTDEGGQPGKIFTVDGVRSDGVIMYDWVYLADCHGQSEHLYYVKPILFPLDSLTKPITIKGETFTPMDKLYELWLNSNNLSDGELVKEDFQRQFRNVNCDKSFNDVSFWAVSILVGWFFDLDNLIGQGKAISVHDLDVNCYV